MEQRLNTNGSIRWKKRLPTTRETLLRAAAELYADQGYDGTTVDQIAFRAGVNKALVSYHFGGKKRLYQEVVASLLEPLVDRLRSLDGEASRHRARRRLLDELSAATARRPFFAAILLREMLDGGRRLDAPLLEQVTTLFSVSRRIMGGRKDGPASGKDVSLAHLHLLGSLLFFAATRSFRHRLLASGAETEHPPSLADFIALLDRLAPASPRRPVRTTAARNAPA